MQRVLSFQCKSELSIYTLPSMIAVSFSILNQNKRFRRYSPRVSNLSPASTPLAMPYEWFPPRPAYIHYDEFHIVFWLQIEQALCITCDLGNSISADVFVGIRFIIYLSKPLVWNRTNVCLLETTENKWKQQKVSWACLSSPLWNRVPPERQFKFPRASEPGTY